MSCNLQAVSTVLDMCEQMHFESISFLERLSTLHRIKIISVTNCQFQTQVYNMSQFIEVKI